MAQENLQNGMCVQHLRSPIDVFTGRQWVAKDPMFLHAESEDSDQSAGELMSLRLSWARMSVVRGNSNRISFSS